MSKQASITHYGVSSLSALAKSTNIPSRPIVLTIEPTNVCNLRCPVCETGAGILRRPKGFMSLSDFKKILDNVGGQVNQILLYFMGESCLNKQIYEMIAEAKRRKIYVSMCTNGDFADGKRLVESGIDEVSFQVGGLAQETHEKYRVGSNFTKAWSEMIQTASWTITKIITGEGYKTKVTAGLIVMKHNEHEVLTFIDKCAHGGINYEIIKPCVRTVEQAREFLPDDRQYWIYDETALDEGILRPKVIPHNCCPWIYYSTVICWNGDVVPCCRDAQGDWVMGNALQDDFGDTWNGLKYQRFREVIATNQKSMKLCQLCSGFGMPRLK